MPEEAIEKNRAQVVGRGGVICVDFAVAAVWIHEAIDDQLTSFIIVEHGVLRSKTVVDLFRHHYNILLIRLTYVPASRWRTSQDWRSVRRTTPFQISDFRSANASFR